MTNQEKPEFEKTSLQVSPLVFVLVAISAISIIVALLNSAINTPLVRSFDDAAKQAEIAACESKNGYKNTEDCYK